MTVCVIPCKMHAYTDKAYPKVINLNVICIQFPLNGFVGNLVNL